MGTDEAADDSAPSVEQTTGLLAPRFELDPEPSLWWWVAGVAWLLLGLILGLVIYGPGGSDQARSGPVPEPSSPLISLAAEAVEAGLQRRGPESEVAGLVVSTPEVASAPVSPPFEVPLEVSAEDYRPPGWRDLTGEWRAAAIAAGNELPGGGIEVFPDRRLVANYGAPVTTSLGVLGEMSFEENLAELVAKADDYRSTLAPGADDVQVLPSLEIIVSVATAAPSPENDYSVFIDLDVVREWVDAAAREGVFVILDLQPGRNDFLSQAKQLEEFLRLPNVGLALDPEWRLEPDQVHLRQIGSVEAAEVNEVVDYLVEIVREERLPQKILVLHQFKPSMLPDRHLIRTPPELAVVVHVDGQGPLSTKYDTWDQLLDFETPPEQNLWWGWKNFYDEDSPRATPAEVNRVEPLPVLVTYQ